MGNSGSAFIFPARARARGGVYFRFFCFVFGFCVFGGGLSVVWFYETAAGCFTAVVEDLRRS